MSQNPLVSSTTKTIFRHLATGTHLHYCQYLWQLQQSLYNVQTVNMWRYFFYKQRSDARHDAFLYC
jgi:hypothetical protein